MEDSSYLIEAHKVGSLARVNLLPRDFLLLISLLAEDGILFPFVLVLFRSMEELTASSIMAPPWGVSQL